MGEYTSCLSPYNKILSTANVISNKELHNLSGKVFNKYSSAVGEKYTTAARRDRLAFLMREVGTPAKAKK